MHFLPKNRTSRNLLLFVNASCGKVNIRILPSIAAIIVSGALLVGATFAFFSDTETSTGNTLLAGALDLKIDNTSYYNNVLNQSTTWLPADLTNQLFFNFDDVKPGDIGEDTISLHAENDCWICAVITLTENNDNTCTEPEQLDDPTCSEPNGNLLDGELAEKINFIFWADDGDNVLENNEATPGAIIDQGTAADVLNNNTITLADSNVNNIGGIDGQPMAGGVTHYIGKAWCFGTLTPTPLAQDGANNIVSPANSTGGVACDGSLLNNATQTDRVLADIKFTAVQSRNNPGYICQPSASPTPTPTPSSTPTPTPTPGPCELQPDVMLVLDRSGSIDTTELAELKTAAKSFVDTLAPTVVTAHVGMVSFSTSSALNHHLSEDGTSVKNSIDALTATGLTNLQAGIDTASGELANPGDGHDRADGSSPDFMVIVTDGNPNQPGSNANAEAVAAAAADAARAAGTVVYVVGVGNDVDATYLQNEIADDAAHYFSVADYSGLTAALNAIANCPQ